MPSPGLKKSRHKRWSGTDYGDPGGLVPRTGAGWPENAAPLAWQSQRHRLNGYCAKQSFHLHELNGKILKIAEQPVRCFFWIIASLHRQILPTFALLADTRMYEQHFGFQSMPFSANPAEWQFFYSESVSAVLPTVLHTLQSATGLAVVTGPAGVGKTVLLNHLQATLSRQGQAINLPGTSLQSIEDLYVSIRRSLKTRDGQPVAGGPSRWEVVERLQSSADFWGPIGLLVDDAQLLTPELFTELQFLLEQRSSSQSLCRVLLAGSHALEESLAQPAMSGFSQRIRTYAFLQPLRPAESVEYLSSRLSLAGGSLAECFDSDAVGSIVEAADGSPRCLNLLADESLFLTFRVGENRVTLETVHAALSSLQHLPHAWNISLSDQSESGPDDVAPSNASWQSSSDGVIEIGAGPASIGVETESDEPELTSTLVDALQKHDTTVDLLVPAASEPETVTDLPAMDELPGLDELKSDPWLDELSETESFVALEDDLEDDSETADIERSFEAGYLLAELESVGDPAVEIDKDLDQRLRGVADEADDVSQAVDAPSCPAGDILPGFPLWQPAGCWDRDRDVIRYRAHVEAADGKAPVMPAVADDSHSDSARVRVYEAKIPAWNEPTPVWPPQTAGFGAVSPVPVTVLTTSEVGEAATHLGSRYSAASVEFATAHVRRPPETAESDRQWSDGQLLNDLASSDDAADEEEAQFIPLEDAGDVIPLRIAGFGDDGSDAQARDDVSTDEASPVPDRLFTLPIALDDVTGECAPLANSVREFQEELHNFQSPDDCSTLPASGPVRTVMPHESSNSTSHSSTELNVEAVVEEADEESLQLIGPRLIGQAKQMLSSASPPRQLRQAAGAENAAFFEESAPTLSVISRDEDPDAAENESKTLHATSDGFHNLFTRLRQRQQ